MKNDSVKFKQSVPKSSTNSLISDFQDMSPIPNGLTTHNFSHALSIQARLSRTSQLSEDNIRFSNPRCRPEMNFIEQDEVLAKSPLTKGLNIPLSNFQSFSEAITQHTKFTKETMKRIKKIEKFIDENLQSSQIDILQDVTPKVSENRCDHYFKEIEIETTEDDSEDTQVTKKLQNMLDDLRILRRHPQLFESYEGGYAMRNTDYQLYVPYQMGNRNGVVVSCGNYLQSIILEGDTFKNTHICDNPEKQNYSALCLPDQHFNDWIVAGSENGSLLVWQQGILQPDLLYRVNSKPTYLTQNIQQFFVGTSDSQVIVLDQRMREKKVFHLGEIDQYSPSPLKMEYLLSDTLDSPKPSSQPMEYFKETNFTKTVIEEELDSATQPSVVSQGVRHIDVMDSQVLVTLKNGFNCYDLRQPNEMLLSNSSTRVDAIKAVFSPNSLNNVIIADKNSHCLNIWSIDEQKLIFSKDMQSAPVDILVAKETREVLTLFRQEHASIINIYDNEHAKLKYVDQLVLDNFQIQRLQLSSNGETLYGFGPYSLRTWKFFSAQEIAMLQKKLTSYVKENRMR